MVMTSIGLSDHVQVATQNSRSITIRSDSGFLPNDKRNLAYQAAHLFLQQMNIKSGLDIVIKKHSGCSWARWRLI